jgi:transposase
MRLRQHHTIRYEAMIYERVKNCSIEEMSREEGLVWEEVELIFNHFAKELEKEEWEAPERISLDEFSNLKGHKDFITTIVELNNKILLDVIKGHKQEELMEALKAQPSGGSREGERSERRYVVRIYSSDQGIISQC